MLIALFIAFVWAIFWLTMDSYYGSKGIKAGVAVEGNPMDVYVAGTNKPTFSQSMAIEAGILRIPLFIVGLVCCFHHSVLASLFISGLFVIGVKNIFGYRAWAALLRKK